LSTAGAIGRSRVRDGIRRARPEENEQTQNDDERDYDPADDRLFVRQSKEH
jgi:hypothetical protein